MGVGGKKQLEVLTKSEQDRAGHTTLCLYLCFGGVSGGSSAFEDQIVRGQRGQWLLFAVRSVL